MTETIGGWVDRAERKITAGVGVSLEDLDELKAVTGEPRRHLLHIWADAD